MSNCPLTANGIDYRGALCTGDISAAKAAIASATNSDSCLQAVQSLSAACKNPGRDDVFVYLFNSDNNTCTANQYFANKSFDPSKPTQCAAGQQTGDQGDSFLNFAYYVQR